MSIEPADFRRVLGHLASGVSIAAAQDGDGAPRGMTATAVTSVSLAPPLVLVCIDRDSDTRACIERTGAFALSFLGDEGESLARRFAEYPAEEKFTGVAYREEMTGSPVLDAALGWVDCHLRASYDGGDHTIFVGEVAAGDARDGGPLLYFRGGYGRLAP